VVVVPFPFTDRSSLKRRPAVVLNDVQFQISSGHVVLGMITSTSGPMWSDDVALADPESAGLSKASRFRLKLATVADDLVIRRAGRLAARDARAVAGVLSRILGS
jgi:mRNA interferase MazF